MNINQSHIIGGVDAHLAWEKAAFAAFGTSEPVSRPIAVKLAFIHNKLNAPANRAERRKLKRQAN